MAFADDVKEYCHTDENVSGYVSAAEAYLANAGIIRNEASPLYGLAVKMLAAYWVDHHITASGESRAPQSYDFGGVLLQLQMSQEEGA